MKTLIAIAIALAVVATSAHAEVIPDFKPATRGVQAAQPPMGDADFVPASKRRYLMDRIGYLRSLCWRHF
jgi:hypothetical protein